MSEPTEQDQSWALRTAVGAEHAAIWVYGLAAAFASESRASSAISEAMRDHEKQRDNAQRLARQLGVTPPVAEAAYFAPESVTDQNSAIRMLITAEDDCQIGWRSVLENTEAPGLRHNALAGMTVSAARATRWRITIDEQPAASAFPGRPG